MEEPLTADLDAEETPFIERLILLNERLLQSGFINSEQAHDDIERLIDMLRAVRER